MRVASQVAVRLKTWDLSFFDRLIHNFYMDRLAFCALIKHIFKTDLKKEKISCAKYLFLSMQTLAFKYSPKVYNEKEIALV